MRRAALQFLEDAGDAKHLTRLDLTQVLFSFTTCHSGILMMFILGVRNSGDAFYVITTLTDWHVST
jgi:hypothetical protein